MAGILLYMCLSSLQICTTGGATLPAWERTLRKYKSVWDYFLKSIIWFEQDVQSLLDVLLTPEERRLQHWNMDDYVRTQEPKWNPDDDMLSIRAYREYILGGLRGAVRNTSESQWDLLVLSWKGFTLLSDNTPARTGGCTKRSHGKCDLYEPDSKKKELRPMEQKVCLFPLLSKYCL